MRTMILAALIAPAAAAAAPQPGALRTFRDWSVGCDNTRRCTMLSLAPDDDTAPGGATLSLARAAGPAGGYEASIDLDDGGTPTALTIDGRRFPITGDALAGPAAARIAAAMAGGGTLTIERRGATPASVSLAGAAAALRYIDAEQGRAGTVTATVATGPAPAARVPAAPPTPVVAAIRLASRGPAPTAAQRAAMNRIGQCEMPRGADATPDTAPLPDGRTLVILPCSAGAYNVIGALFVIDRAGRATPASLDAPAGFEATGADSQTPVRSVVNGGFEGGLLTSYAKGRGLGDCGLDQSFAWDGRRLRLVEQRDLRECRGNVEKIPTWRARVIWR